MALAVALHVSFLLSVIIPLPPGRIHQKKACHIILQQISKLRLETILNNFIN